MCAPFAPVGSAIWDRRHSAKPEDDESIGWDDLGLYIWVYSVGSDWLKKVDLSFADGANIRWLWQSEGCAKVLRRQGVIRADAAGP